MVTIKIKENSRQAKLFLEYAKSLSFVEFISEKDKKINSKKNEFEHEIEKSLLEIKKIREGKSQALTTKALWDE